MQPPYTVIKQGARGRFRWQHYVLDYTDPDTGISKIRHACGQTVRGSDSYEKAWADAYAVIWNPGPICQEYDGKLYYQDDNGRWFPV